MKKYEILEHPAELRLRIYGKTIEELFSNAAEAMAQVLCSKPEIKNQKRPFGDSSKTKIKIDIKSIDINSLLVDFLSEILAKSQINKAVYLVLNINVRGQRLKVKSQVGAELIGYPIERFDEDIKAVTYYGVDIKKNPQGIWQTEIVFDV